jgi:hypothetical protein
MKLIPAIRSIGELHMLATKDPKYKQLALIASSNLGGEPTENLNKAINWLRINADETDEAGVVGEINFCRDLVK